MNDPVEVTCGTKNQAASTVEHQYYLIDNRDRYRTLRRLVDASPDIYAIIFVVRVQKLKVLLSV